MHALVSRHCMWVILAFWIFLAVPGFACLCRFDRASLEGGWLAVIVRSYVASVVLLTPISVLGYVFHWSVAALSLAYLALVVAGVALIIRDRTRAAWLGYAELSLIAVLGACFLLFDAWVGARVGSHVQGDAAYHIARVRMLLDNHLGSWDPLLPGLQFEAVYHTNIYHALIAASAHLGGVDPGVAWVWVWPFAKLMLAATSYELALSVFGTQRLAWIAAIGASIWFLTQSVLSLPNTLAPFVCLPFAVARIVVAVSGKPSFRNALWVGAAGLVVAQVHMLYATFLLLLATPVVVCRLGYAVARRERGRAELLAAVLCLATPVPWLVVPALPRLESVMVSTAHAQADQPSAVANPRAVKQRKADLFVDAGEGRVTLDVRDFIAVTSPVAYMLAGLALFAVVTRRRAPWVIIALSVVLGVYLFVPAICTALIQLLAGSWVVVRMTSVLDILCTALLPASVIGIVGQMIALASRSSVPPWFRVSTAALLELAGCAGAFAYAYAFAPRAEPWSPERTWEAARTNQAQTNADRIAARAQFFATVFRKREEILVPLMLDYDLPMHCNCSPFAFREGRGNRNIVDVYPRRIAAERFFVRETTAEERLETARRFHIKYVYSSARRLKRYVGDLAPLVKNTSVSGSDAIIELSP